MFAAAEEEETEAEGTLSAAEDTYVDGMTLAQRNVAVNVDRIVSTADPTKLAGATLKLYSLDEIHYKDGSGNHDIPAGTEQSWTSTNTGFWPDITDHIVSLTPTSTTTPTTTRYVIKEVKTSTTPTGHELAWDFYLNCTTSVDAGGTVTVVLSEDGSSGNVFSGTGTTPDPYAIRLVDTQAPTAGFGIPVSVLDASNGDSPLAGIDIGITITDAGGTKLTRYFQTTDGSTSINIKPFLDMMTADGTATLTFPGATAGAEQTITLTADGVKQITDASTLVLKYTTLPDGYYYNPTPGTVTLLDKGVIKSSKARAYVTPWKAWTDLKFTVDPKTKDTGTLIPDIQFSISIDNEELTQKYYVPADDIDEGFSNHI